MSGLAGPAQHLGLRMRLKCGFTEAVGSPTRWREPGIFEPIHRSNLIGMGVIPLQCPACESAASLKLDGTEVFDITGIEAPN